MKCRQAKDLIGAYLYGDLAPDEMRNLRVHAQECAICREDLASRGRIVSSLDDKVPTLSDEDRLRIAWSVKGAVRKEELQRKPLVRRLVPALALAGVLVAAVFTGKYIVTHNPPATVHNTAASPAEPSVEIKELPTTGNNPKSDKIVNQISELLESLMSPSTATIAPDRGSASSRKPERQPNIASENPFNITPEHLSQHTPALPQVDLNSVDPPKDSAPVVNKTETGAGSDSTELPRVTDPKNAETVPSDN